MKFKNQKREMTLTSDVLSDNNDRTVLLAFSSENPVVRTIGGQEYNEILLHNPENVNLERLQNKAALLFNHDFDNHIGVVESASIDADRVGRALVRFSSVGMGAEKYEMVREGTLTKVSLGYSIDEYRIEGDNLLITKWTPFEISTVSVPADDLVGVGRSLEEEQEPEVPEPENNDEQPAEQEERNEETENEPDENTESTTTATESDPEIDTEAETINNSESNGDGEQPEPEEQNDDSAVQEEQAEEDQKRIAEINAISRAFNIHAEITNQAIETGLSIDAFRQQIKNKPIIKDDKMEFSLNTLIRSIMDGDKSLPSGKNGAVVANADFAQAVRAGVTTTTAKDIIHTDVLYGSFVDILRAESVLKNFPVQMFTGLTSEIAVPKLAGDFTAGFGFISENGVSPEVDANFESVVLKPKTFTGSVPLSRSVVRSCPQVEQIVSQAIVAGSAERLEALILKGIVDAVVAAGKVETVDAYTYAGIVAAQGQLGDEGVSYGSIAAVMSPQTKATLRSTLRGENTAGVYLFDEGDLCGVPAYDSKVLAGQNFIILGDFSKVAIAQWGDSLELDMDDTTNRNRGSVIARVWADLDFAVLVPEAFRIIKLA
ncbi:phage major capsid protein [Leclercia sp. G3L]|uniref:phage major capsid protein n=1 Tax=Leclercia sp. G3L TaxID=2898725 RepID=UPI001E62F41F|nr:phage major capsid protein [Leclercia sp. G3L]UGB02238.1 phage major capsid protein [Leclercia sp. G3L]